MTDPFSLPPPGCSERGAIRLGVVLAAFQCSLLVTSEKVNRVKWFFVHYFNQAAVTHTKHVKLIHGSSPCSCFVLRWSEATNST